MHLTIEPVRIDEVKTLAEISSSSFYDTYHKHNSKENMQVFIAESFNTPRLTQELASPHNYFFFARTGDEIAGYIKLSDAETQLNANTDEAMEIARIYVVKDKIGKGIGKKLMDFAVSFAKKQNKKEILLGVWANNVRALTFYTRCGFKKCGKHIFMLGSDRQTDWLMKKELVKYMD